MSEKLTNQTESFTAKLNAKYHIFTTALGGLCVFGWYGVIFFCTNTILMGDEPITGNEKLVMTVIMTVFILSWTVSFVTMLVQIFKRKAFTIDKSGVHDTLSLTVFLAFIFVVPIKEIPTAAIKNIQKTDGITNLVLDKSKVRINPIFRPFMKKSYNLMYGFTNVKYDSFKDYLTK